MDHNTHRTPAATDEPTRDEVRAAKMRLIETHGDIRGVGSFGIGWTEDGSSMAVTVAVSNESMLARIPKNLDGVPVRAYLSGPGQAF